MSTFDRQPVDVNAYATGDYWLLKNNFVHIQGRYQLSADFEGNRSAVGAIAVGGPFLEGSKLTVEPKSGAVKWNDEMLSENTETELATSTRHVLVKTYSNADPENRDTPSGVEVKLPFGVFLEVRRYTAHLNVKITTKKLPGSIDGQCGNFNGDAMDDTIENIESRMHSVSVAPEDLLFRS